MRNDGCFGRLLALVLLSLAVCSSALAASTTGLPRFSSEQALQAFLHTQLAAKEKQEQEEKEEQTRMEAKWKEEAAKAAAAKKAAGKKATTSAPANSTGSIAGNTAPGAAVVIENAASGFKREITAGNDGDYRLSGLPPGSYKITTNGGSRTVEVSVGSSANLAAVEAVGTGTVNPIDVSSVESTTIMTSEEIAAVPVPRNITQVALLSPGTVSSPAKPDADTITNVQTAGVDEGGIVKKAGDYLVVLRRGRLFTVKVTASELKPIAAINAYGPGLSPEKAWYDEMLISGDTVVVIGYSYRRGGTEVGLFQLVADGRLRYRATYHLRSNDYYSSRNYASRLVGDTLYLYAPMSLFQYESRDIFLPGVRRWGAKRGKAPFKRILSVDRLYRSGLGEQEWWQTLHSVTRCKIAKGALDCNSTAVLGPESDAFYVSQDAVYVWVSDWSEGSAAIAEAAVLRIPLDESRPPSMLLASGSPTDQLSFLEKDGYLNVLVGGRARGQRMWAAEGDSGKLALLRVPLSRFGGQGATTAPEHYRALPPKDEDRFWSLQNRYVGDWLVYGSEWNNERAYAVRIDRQDAPIRLNLGHGVERIEAMGQDALIVGQTTREWNKGLPAARRRSDTVLSSVGLGESARIAMQYLMPGASQSDDRTHGFFYRPLGSGEGVFGLPIQRAEPESAMIRFLRNQQLTLSGLGELEAKPGPRRDDGCKASCYDWYGDARPIFIGNRVYGLMGYELVEGELVDGRIRERRRANFQPKPVKH